MPIDKVESRHRREDVAARGRGGRHLQASRRAANPTRSGRTSCCASRNRKRSTRRDGPSASRSRPAQAPDPTEVERGLTWFQRISDPNVVLHRLEQEENQAEDEYDAADGAAERSGRSPDRRRSDARGARPRRDPPHARRRRAADAALDARHDSPPRALARARHRLDRRRHLRRQRRPRRRVRHRVGHGRLHRRQRSRARGGARRHARQRALDGRRRVPRRRSRSARCTSRRSRASAPRSKRIRTKNSLELELFYQLKGFSRR